MNKPLFAWVIENLCKNAVDAMEGEGNIRFECIRNTPPRSSWNVMDVTDTGKGIVSSSISE